MARRGKTRRKKKATKDSPKEKKEEVKTLEVISQGERIPLKAKEIISVKVAPLNRPRGIPVENYTFKRNELRLAVPLPTRERIQIKYKA